MKQKSSKIFLFIALGVLLLVLIGGYVFGVVYFHSHFLLGTSINGIECGKLTVQEVKQKISDELMEYQLLLKERDGKEETIEAEALGLEYVDDKSVEAQLENQNPYKWPFSGSTKKSVSISAGTRYNADNIDGILDGLDCFATANVVAPSNASVGENDQGFMINAEVQGNTINRDAMKQAVIEALDSGKTTLDLEASNLYQKPTILSTDEALNAQVSQLNTLTAAHITYNLGGREYTVDRDMIKSWLVKDDQGNYSLNEAAVTSYITQMAYDTDTFGLEHQFKTSLGPTITLAKGGDYGWVIDKEATTQTLLDAIKSGANEALDPSYIYKGTDRSSNDIGGTYVEVCITQQKMWCYKDGQLVVETPVITGNNSQGFDTPSGSVWAIDAKKPNAHFNAANVDVECWLPFNGEVGIHDAAWRTPAMYNTTTYLTGGSHGCVNTPLEAVRKIFDTMEIGYPVIVYYSTDQPVGPQPTQENKAG